MSSDTELDNETIWDFMGKWQIQTLIDVVTDFPNMLSLSIGSPT